MRINQENYVDKAEKSMKELIEDSKAKSKNGRPDIVTTSKIRNLLAMTADIYNRILQSNSEKLDPDICGDIEYLRIRFLYECGRDEKVRKFVEKSELLDILKEIKQEKENYLLFSRYVEALVAFHKFNRGKEQ